MQDRPSAPELLATIAEVLETEVVPAAEGLPQHYARVAASLSRILEREAQLGAENEANEIGRLQKLLGSDDADVRALNRALDQRLAAGVDVGFAREVWTELVAIARDKLRITKPGYDAYDFRAEVDP